MRERELQREFSKFVINNNRFIRNYFGSSVVFELKISKEKSIRFDSVAEHQVVALTGAIGDGMYHKINDMPFIKDNPRFRFTNPKPFDCFFISGAAAYVVVYFYKLRQRKESREVLFCPIKRWLEIWKCFGEQKRMSIKEEELREYCDKVNIFVDNPDGVSGLEFIGE